MTIFLLVWFFGSGLLACTAGARRHASECTAFVVFFWPLIVLAFALIAPLYALYAFGRMLTA